MKFVEETKKLAKDKKNSPFGIQKPGFERPWILMSEHPQ